MHVMLLGPLRVLDGDHEIDLGGPRNRALVARLALDAGRPVSARRLIEDLWSGDVPADATNALQSIVSRTRRRLPEGVLGSTSAGYVLYAEVDVDEFRRLVAEGRTGEGLALWRGEVLADIRDFPFVDGLAAGLTEARLAAVEQDLAARQPDGGMVAELAGLTRTYPYRDGLWLLYLEALVACGRPSEALTAYESMRAQLANHLGADPSAQLQALHAQILRGEVTARPRRRSSLPAALTSFVGRDGAVEDVQAAVRSHRLVTILGPGGVGKTRLAVESARACVDWFQQVWLVELAPITGEEEIVSAILSAMGLLEVSVLDRPGVAQRQDLRSRLLDAVADAEGLLILDNCEHLVGAVASITGEILARGAGLRALTTSREALKITGEYAYQLGSLAIPGIDASVEAARRCSAIQLFVERARMADQSFVLDAGSLPAVREVCFRLDGLPLAIELAAARLRTLTAAEVAARLSDRFRLLTGGSRTALPRHRTLHAVVKWSWDLLTERERDLLERVSVFPAGVSVGGAAAIFGSAGDTSELLESLADKSLLVAVRGAQRFRMLETLREYGVERLVERGVVEQVRSAQLDYVVALAEDLAVQMRAGRQVWAISMIDTERGNLTAALRYAIDRSDRARAARVVRALAWYWLIRNEHVEADNWVMAVLALPGTADPAAEIACAALAATGVFLMPREDRDWRVLTERILVLWDRHHPDDSYTAVVMATLAHFGLIGDRKLTVPADLWTRCIIGLVRLVLLENAGRLEGVTTLLEETLDGFRVCGDGWGLATALGLRGTVEAYDGEFERALAAWTEALPLLEALGAEEDFTYSRLRVLSLRLVTADGEQLVELRRELTKELDAAARQGNRQVLLLARLGLSHVERAAGDNRASSAHLRALLEHVDARGAFGGGQLGAMARASLAASAADDGEFDVARQEFAVAAKIATETQDMPIVAYVAVMAAVLAHQLREDTRAARLLGAAVAIRGREDRSNRDVRVLGAVLRESLGAARYEAAHAEGARLDRDAALAFALQPL